MAEELFKDALLDGIIKRLDRTENLLCLLSNKMEKIEENIRRGEAILRERYYNECKLCDAYLKIEELEKNIEKSNIIIEGLFQYLDPNIPLLHKLGKI